MRWSRSPSQSAKSSSRVEASPSICVTGTPSASLISNIRCRDGSTAPRSILAIDLGSIDNCSLRASCVRPRALRCLAMLCPSRSARASPASVRLRVVGVDIQRPEKTRNVLSVRQPDNIVKRSNRTFNEHMIYMLAHLTPAETAEGQVHRPTSRDAAEVLRLGVASLQLVHGRMASVLMAWLCLVVPSTYAQPSTQSQSSHKPSIAVAATPPIPEASTSPSASVESPDARLERAAVASRRDTDSHLNGSLCDSPPNDAALR